MKNLYSIVVVLLCASTLVAQFDVTKYKEYIDSHKGYSAEQLRNEYNAGLFLSSTNTDYSSAQYYDAANSKFSFTAYEKELLAKHSFMVTNRVSYPTFSAAFYDVYNKDLPVYISSDAVLHALHRSYNNMLKDIEKIYISKRLAVALQAMHERIRTESLTMPPKSVFEQKALEDADVYVTVARRLLQPTLSSITPVFTTNERAIGELLTLISDEQFASYPLFASVNREIDFSQFTPRGHYNDNGELAAYFKTMMWFGRTEIYITAPQTEGPKPTKEDIARQCALSLKVAQIADNSNALATLDSIDSMISLFVGAQDNITTRQVLEAAAASSTTFSSFFTDSGVQAFQDACIARGAEQRILSQVLYSGGVDIKPAAAYMLMGQRFIIDSYIFMNVVHDKVDSRMMPSTLDAMFALGNNSALHFLEPEITRYNYAPNLAGLRYLCDSYASTDWNSSLYATWLQAIRTLNPPKESDRETLPVFMKTAAWWQKTLNTQLASWAELRHDNLLYAKQSYTGGIGCFYPEGFVEPVPELYNTIKAFTKNFSAALQGVLPALENGETVRNFVRTMKSYDTVMTALESIARKELRHEPVNEYEKSVIKNWIMNTDVNVGCGTEAHYSGHYQSLLYGVDPNISLDNQPDFIVADVHTQPTDEQGNTVGKVLHVGTGAPTLAVVIATDNDGCATTFCGPVSSYFEHTSQNFTRLTDEEWRTTYTSKGMRPRLTNLYMANAEGTTISTDKPSLVVGVETDSMITKAAVQPVYPNPFSAGTMIGFTAPQAASTVPVRIAVYTAQGELVKELHNATVSVGNHSIRWDGTNSQGNRVAQGAYIYTITMGNYQHSGTVVFEKQP